MSTEVDLTPAAGVVTGETKRITTTVTDSAGDAADPNALTFAVTTPAAATTTYTYGTDAELVKSATGIYYVDYTFATAGMYHVVWTATDANSAVDKHLERVWVDG